MDSRRHSIDLRSDTVTKPCDAMRAAMTAADVGDDVYGEDPTVNQLESVAAEMLGKESALFCPTGTMSNLIGLMSHCGRGDEYIVGDHAHTFLYEGGGAAVLGSIQPQTVAIGADGTMAIDQIQDAIKPADVHYARTKLVCLEDTHGGRYLPKGYAQSVRDVCDTHGLSLHLDGARLFNAVVGSGNSAETIAAPYDSISICLSKGLGAPIGSVLVGSKDFIKEGRHWRKMLGGGMRQAGCIAAAGLYALAHNIDRLDDDHQRAKRLADTLLGLTGLTVDYPDRQTNMVYVHVADSDRQKLGADADKMGVILPQGGAMRLVIHKDISDADINIVSQLFAQLAV